MENCLAVCIEAKLFTHGKHTGKVELLQTDNTTLFSIAKYLLYNWVFLCVLPEWKHE